MSRDNKRSQPNQVDSLIGRDNTQLTSTISMEDDMSNVLYADLVNQQFNKSQSHYVDIATRLRESIQEDWKQQVLADSIATFKSVNRGLKRWEDLVFCRSLTSKLSMVDIDITLQRLLNISNCGNIINNFDQLLVMPICVYEDKFRPGRYVCWDGQHTAISLYIIAKMVFGKTLDEIEVPIVIYNSNLKSDIRRNFIQLNGEAKDPLDYIDKVHQKIHGVRTDGSQDPNWIEVNDKQKALEKNKIFLTHRKFGDVDQPGAYSRLDEFIDDGYPVVITENFATYFFKVCQSSRPVQPKESWMLYEFFNLCRKQRIDVTDDYILGVANSLKTAFGGDFDSYLLHSLAKRSYQEWYRINKPNPDGSLLGITYSEMDYCMPFLIAQIGKNFDQPLPRYRASWTVPKGDLL